MADDKDKPSATKPPVEVNVEEVDKVDLDKVKVDKIDLEAADDLPELERQDSKGDGLSTSGITGMVGDIKPAGGDGLPSIGSIRAEDGDDTGEDLPRISIDSKDAIEIEYMTTSDKYSTEYMLYNVSSALGFKFIPLIRPLTVKDLDACVALENDAFTNPDHRASREKIEYRLTRCPELSMGIFVTVKPEHQDLDLSTMGAAGPMETGRADKHMLLAHIISTRTKSEVIVDDSMRFPADWKTDNGAEARTGLGHQKDGRTVALHSLAVAQNVHRCGLGSIIMKSYIQRMLMIKDVDRVTLIAQPHLISFYSNRKFDVLGMSQATFGGGGWLNLECPKHKMHKAYNN